MAPPESYDVYITFGKYKGQSLGFILDSDPSYLKWIAATDTIRGDWSKAAMALLNNQSIAALDLPHFTVPEHPPQIFLSKYKNQRIKAEFEYNPGLLERFKFEVDGRVWKDGYWVFPNAQILKAVDVFGLENIQADKYVREVYKEEVSRKQELNVIRDKFDENDFQVNGLLLPLYPYQVTGVEFVVRAGGRAMIADDCGSGKTVQSIGYAAHTNAKTLIICPKSVVVNWSREILRFTGQKATIWTTTEIPSSATNSQFSVIGYETAVRQAHNLRKIDFELLICDEATLLKNRNTKRSKAILGDSRAKRKIPGIRTKDLIFCSGTPVLNRPVEAFSLLHTLDPSRFSNFYQFTQKYGGWKGSEPRNLLDLHERTKDLVIRRTQDQFMPDLPPIQRNSLYVELTKQERLEYDKLLKQLFRNWSAKGKPTVAELPAIQGYLIERKMSRLQEMIDEYLEQDLGILVFCTYIAPLVYLAKQYSSNSALIHGQMTLDERQESIDALASGKKKVGLISINSGAMGIDSLQTSISTLVFLDRSFVPAIHHQAESRLFRIGQTKHVQSYYFTCEDTIDEYMASILEEKQKLIDLIVDGQPLGINAGKSFFGEFVQALKAGQLENFDFSLGPE